MYKNIIEDFVVKRARYLIAQQKTQQKSEACKDINLSALAAIALNNLQPLYATTLNGWINQRLNATKNFHDEIEVALNHAFMKVQKGGPLNSFSPMPESELNSNAYSLIKISRILGKENIRWREIPKLLELAIAEKNSQPNKSKDGDRKKLLPVLAINNSIQLNNFQYNSTDNGKDKVKENTVISVLSKSSQINTNKIPERSFFEQEVLDSYLLRAKLRIINVMEKVVEEMVLDMMHEWSGEIKTQLNTEAIEAFALNRLPPMYATSELGCRFLRSKATNQFQQEINLIVSDALVHVKGFPDYNYTPPLPIYQLEDEMAKVMPKIRLILKRPDVNAENLVKVLVECLG